MKELYESLSIEITELDVDDAITTSGFDPEDFGGEAWDDGDGLIGLL